MTGELKSSRLGRMLGNLQQDWSLKDRRQLRIRSRYCRCLGVLLFQGVKLLLDKLELLDKVQTLPLPALLIVLLHGGSRCGRGRSRKVW